MDRFGVLVFHDQHFDDDQQISFSRQLGMLEEATGDIMSEKDRRLSMDLNDISNLDKTVELLPRDDRRRLFGLGNLLWHSDSSFKEVPAKYSMLSARKIPLTGGNTEFADMRAAYDALDDDTKDEVHDLICLHSQIFSRGVLGFDDFTDAERAKWAPVRQGLSTAAPPHRSAFAVSGKPCRRVRAMARMSTIRRCSRTAGLTLAQIFGLFLRARIGRGGARSNLSPLVACFLHLDHGCVAHRRKLYPLTCLGTAMQYYLS